MSIYDELGITKIINGGGTLTKLGGSKMAPEVLTAMNEAAGAFVDIQILHSRAGEKIAGLLGVEAAFITSGAAAGIAISAAACMSRGAIHKTLQLPDTTGMPNEVLMLKSHRISPEDCGPRSSLPPLKMTRSAPWSRYFLILDAGGSSAAASTTTGIRCFFIIDAISGSGREPLILSFSAT